MSLENEKTVEVYTKLANLYIHNSLEKESEDVEAAQRKRKQLQDFLRLAFSTLSDNALVFEIGSGAGENAEFLAQRGFSVTASDVAPAFINETRERGIETILFNALEDDFPRKYYGILCWRVFVHFTQEDAKLVLEKTYNALEKRGRLIFNALNIDNYRVSSEWVDFSGTYHMGVKRFYHYYQKHELDMIIDEIGFKTVSFSCEGGKDNNKWFVYVLEKT